MGSFGKLCWEPSTAWFLFNDGCRSCDTRFQINDSLRLCGSSSGCMKYGYRRICFGILSNRLVAQMKRANRMIENQEQQEKRTATKSYSSSSSIFVRSDFSITCCFFIGDHKVRLGVVVVAVSLGLVLLGRIGVILKGTPAVKSCFMVLFGGLLAMAITFGLSKLIGSSLL